MLTETAFAKINLALHVRERRADGYHAIETLFAFVDDGDRLTVEALPEGADRLTIAGEFADDLSDGPDNLVLRAVALGRSLGARAPPLAIALEKNLPVAAGLGGGSADAGAMLRLIAREWAGPVGLERLVEASAALGADVPVCVRSDTAIGRGVGEQLTSIESADVGGAPVLLINPLIPLSTGPVFAGWDGEDRGGLTEGGALAIARAGRNDLQAAAVALCPEIEDVLAVLRAQLPMMTRMSGSGATCFALFDSADALDAATQRIWADHPDWWLMAGRLR